MDRMSRGCVVVLVFFLFSKEYKVAGLDGLITAYGSTTKSSSTPATPCNGGEPDSKRARFHTSTSNRFVIYKK